MYSRKNGWKWTVAALASCAAAGLGIALTSSAEPSSPAGVGGDLAHGPTMSAGSRMSSDASVGDGEVWLAGASSGLTVASGSTGTSATASASMASVGVGGMSQTEAP